MEFLKGERELPCTAWGNPTYNVKGWKGPCYLITDGHYKTFEDLMTKTPWESYGTGNDPRCEHCMVHCGYRAVGRLRHQLEIRRSVQIAELAVELIRLAQTTEMKPFWLPARRDFMGWHVARKLMERGEQVRALVRIRGSVRELGVEPVQGDLRDPDRSIRAVAGCGVVFHVAADYRLWARIRKRCTVRTWRERGIC